jgi:hypothetical protein
MRGATLSSSRSNAAIAALVHLSSTSIAFSHSMTMVTGGSFVPEEVFATLVAGAFAAVVLVVGLAMSCGI